jgi:nitroimidazol reductase NimA-like FMN-containing flavoprotein (pyridoxamine 5'-phosphate oxidase superfamily)
MVTMVKGGTELLQDPVAQELLASRIPARLAYSWTDGTPRVVSIWFHWDGTDIVMASLPGAPKLKALHTGDRVAVTIDTNDPPHHILSIRGTAEVTETQGGGHRVCAGGRALSGQGAGRGLCRVVAA